jgi:hypothetical protein
MMPSERTLALIEGWLDEGLDEQGLAELESLLLESAEARAEFWQRAAFHGDLREAAKIACGTLPETLAAGAPPGWWRVPSRGALWRAAMILVSGGVGAALTSLGWSSSAPMARQPAALIIHEEGFESPPPPRRTYIPRETDVWSGDETAIVGEDRGVSPRSGSRMLRFVSPHPEGDPYQGNASEIWRVVDLDRLREMGDPSTMQVELSASFNAAAPPPGASLSCGLNLLATDSPPETLGPLWLERFWSARPQPSSVSVAKTVSLLDDDPATWQRLSATVTIPPGARYLVLHCVADGMVNGSVRWVPAGQYVDDITVVATPAVQLPGLAPANQQGGAR